MTTLLPVTLLVLVVLVVALEAQNDRCMRRKRFCVANSVCNENRKRCRCPRGTRGNPLFDCYPKEYDNCQVIGDPSIRLFPKSRGKLFLPCRHHLARFNTPLIDTPKTCKLNVFGTAELQPSGSYYEDEAEICFTIGENSIYFRFDREGISRTTDEHGFLANGDKWITTPIDQPLSLDFDEATIEISMDSDNIVHFHVRRCDITIKFRLSTPGEEPQTEVPGVSVTTPSVAHFPPSQALCASPDDDRRDLRRKARELGLSVNQYLLYQSLRFAPPQNRGEFKLECSLVCSIFKTKCSEEDRIKAIKTCFPILAKKKMVACIQEIPTEENLMDLFHKCVEAICLENYFACEAVKKFTFKCPQSKILRNLDCGSPPPLLG